MHVSTFMSPVEKVVTCHPNDSIQKALDLMITKRLGSVVVLDPEQKETPRPVGIVTRSNMLEAFSKGFKAEEHTLSDIMQTDVVTVPWTMDKDEAAKVFEREKKHHALVLDNSGNWKGLISSMDIAAEAARDAHAWPWNRVAVDTGKFDSPESPTGPIDGVDRRRRSSYTDLVDHLKYTDW